MEIFSTMKYKHNCVDSKYDRDQDRDQEYRTMNGIENDSDSEILTLNKDKLFFYFPVLLSTLIVYPNLKNIFNITIKNYKRLLLLRL